MELIYRQQFFVDPTVVNRYGCLKPSMMLRYAQEVAGHHSDSLALTYDALAEQGLFWAVIRNRLQITRLPMEGETITVETWPMPTTRVAYPRATAAYDAQGKELFRSVSLWVLMDRESRAMVRPGKSGVTVEGILRGNEIDPPGSLVPMPLKNRRSRTVCFTDLDRNGHTNNARYLDWIDDLLPSAFHAEHSPAELTLCYMNETLEGQELDLNWDVSDEGVLNVDIHRSKADDTGDYDRIFAARIRFDDVVL